MTTIGERVRQLRTEQRLTLEQLAARVGMSKSFLSEIENAQRRLSTESLIRVAQALGASADYLLRGEDVDTPLSAPDVIPRELAAFAEKEGLSYAKTIELLQAHNSVIARRSKEGVGTLSVDDWERLYRAINDIFG